METPGLRPNSSLPYPSHLNLEGAVQRSSALTKDSDFVQPRLFYLFRIRPTKAQGLHLCHFQHREFT